MISTGKDRRVERMKTWHILRRVAVAFALIFVSAAVTPAILSAQTVYRPSAAIVAGSGFLLNADYAWDESLSTSAGVVASKLAYQTASSPENVTFYGFPNVTAGSVLTFNARVSISGTTGYVGIATIWASFDGGTTYTNFLTFTGNAPQTAYQLPVPSGTDLQNVRVRVYTAVAAAPHSGSGYTSVNVYDINIQ
jgi:hypothetical protein